MSRTPKKRPFGMASAEEIRSGRVTDVYFKRAKEILAHKEIDAEVAFEAQTSNLPQGDWGIFCGLDGIVELLRDLPVDLWALPEGTLFRSREPVLLIRGRFSELATYQTAVLGFLCQASGIATKSARCVIAADGRPVYSFGARRMHPAIAPMIERAAYIGGCTGVASVVAAEHLQIEPVGTIPHGLVLILGDSASAMLAFDEVIEKEVKRVAIVDTFGDEKFEALENAELLDKNIYAVRLETPSSRRGDMLQIAREVRWELDIHGFKNVKILISGGMDEDLIPPLNEVADEYGVDTPISNAPVVNFSLGIVEIEGDPVAKRGMESGAKQLYLCEDCNKRFVRLFTERVKSCMYCKGRVRPLLTKIIDQGRLAAKEPSAEKIRDFVLGQLPQEL